MNDSGTRCAPARPALLALAVSLALATSVAHARPPDDSAKLDANAKELIRQQRQGTLSRAAPVAPAPGNSPVKPKPLAVATLDEQGRVLVNVRFTAGQRAASATQAIKGAFPDSDVQGTLDGDAATQMDVYVRPEQLEALAAKPWVKAISLVPPPARNVGEAQSQGVVQHRVDKLPPGANGAGITVGALSDSFNFRRTNVRSTAAQDVAKGDLPGPGNPDGYTTPVVVIQDSGNSDEGRAMLQIVHDVAPAAKLCFATANGGTLNFADNIRRLADPNGPCGAQVIVDDIVYLSEPMFSDGVIARAIDEVAANGVAYFSSAGNRPGTNGYDSALRIVPGKASSTAGSNIDLTGVDPALYAGGFHDFRDGGGIDIAQTISVANGTQLVLQWDDPYDTVPDLGAVLFEAAGTLPPGGNSDTSYAGTAGQKIYVTVDGVPSGSIDLVLTILDPNGNVLAGPIDTGTSPESVGVTLPVTGNYTIRVSGFEPADQGPLTITVRELRTQPEVTSDFNALFFDMDGQFLFATAANNIASGRPIEITGFDAPAGQFPLQLVIARANVPSGTPKAASRIRYVFFDSDDGTGTPQEYYSYFTPTTYGHNTARGANGVAAYGAFRPSIPESFTSVGPATIYFDTVGQRLARPEVRRRPNLAATDGVNTTFFISDSGSDSDALPNFFGTSAAAPHAAAIAALVLQKNGGPGSLTPERTRRILEASAVPHDLDPFTANAVLVGNGAVMTFKAVADASAISQFDPEVFRVGLAGNPRLTRLTFDGSNADPTGAVLPPSFETGIVFDERPGAGQAFVLGKTFLIDESAISASLGPQAPAPAVAGQSYTLNLAFPRVRPLTFFTFGIDRDEARNASLTAPAAAGGNSADLLGAGVPLPYDPKNAVLPGGMRIEAVINGRTFSTKFRNEIGFGWTPVDGYGFVDAVRALAQPK